MLVNKPDRLLRILLGWTAVTLIFTWLPLIRGVMDGNSYIWGASYFGTRFGGHGVGGHYWLVALQALVALLILGLGWRGVRSPFHLLLLLWHGFLASTACYSSYTNPDDYRFRGDSLDIDVSLAWVGPLFYGGFFLLAVLWVIRDLRRGQRASVPAWSSVNTTWLALLSLLLPIQFLLLRFGEQHGTTDRIGVILTIAQCLLLGRIFRPVAARPSSGMLTAPA